MELCYDVGFGVNGDGVMVSVVRIVMWEGGRLF